MIAHKDIRIKIWGKKKFSYFDLMCSCSYIYELSVCQVEYHSVIFEQNITFNLAWIGLTLQWLQTESEQQRQEMKTFPIADLDTEFLWLLVQTFSWAISVSVQTFPGQTVSPKFPMKFIYCVQNWFWQEMKWNLVK